LEQFRDLVRIDWLDQVVVETGLLRESAVLLGTPAGDSN